MGFWSDLGGVALGAVGVATGQPELVGAGIGVLANGVKSDQTSKAANAQIGAGQQALGIQQGVYQNQQQSLAPYMALGTGALGNLGTLAGIPAGSAGGGVAALPRSVPVNQGTGLGSLASTPAPADRQILGVHVPPPQETQSGFVQMRAPDGSTNQVPAALVNHYQALGATVQS